MIGTLGDIAFEVSEEKIRTFNNYKFSAGANYSEHNIHGKKGLLEFTGLKASNITLDITFDESLGLTVDEELDELLILLDTHKPVKFILDGKIQGWDKWVIEGVDVSHEIVNNKGRTIKAVASVKLREYVSKVE